MTFKEKVAHLRSFDGGTVAVTDHRCDHREPYRYAQLKARCVHMLAPGVAGTLASLAVWVDGYMTMNVFDKEVEFAVAVSRPLTEAEIEGVPPSGYRTVEQSAA